MAGGEGKRVRAGLVGDSPRVLLQHHFRQTDIPNLKTTPKSCNLVFRGQRSEVRGQHTSLAHTYPLLAEVERELANEGGLACTGGSSEHRQLPGPVALEDVSEPGESLPLLGDACVFWSKESLVICCYVYTFTMV